MAYAYLASPSMKFNMHDRESAVRQFLKGTTKL
jgi:hypothetical protein